MIKIKIDTQNTVFDNVNHDAEVVKILRALADNIENYGITPGLFHGTYKNPVCTVEYTGKDR